LKAQSGAVLSLDGVLDLNDMSIDAHMKLSGEPAPNALIAARPELAVHVTGPLAAPEKTVDVSPLVAWLSLRAAELQTRHLELIEANRRDDVPSPVLRPASPAIRFTPMGTALEMTDRADPSAAPILGARSLERLRPEAPSAPQRPASEADKATANAASAEPERRRSIVQQPPPRSPLDLLFRSQN
jgi:hypothetical protein